MRCITWCLEETVLYGVAEQVACVACYFVHGISERQEMHENLCTSADTWVEAAVMVGAGKQPEQIEYQGGRRARRKMDIGGYR